MKCGVCGRENEADASFCMQCGNRIGAACAACGRPTPPDAVFCSGCGQRLASPAAAAAVPAAPAHLVEKARAARPELEGERKQITVLFADVKGSMDLAENLDPEAWHAVMDRFMRILTGGVHRFEGTVDKFTGDGIMALFGAPVAHEDHARRACYAALYLHEEIRRYAEELRRSRGLSFHARIGLNSGEVVVGAIGDDSHMEYTALGHTVGLAQRMEGLAEPGRAYLTEHTARLVSGWFQLRDLGPFSVKGSREPVGVSVLEGIGAVRTGYDVARARGLSRLVGRDREMTVLEGALVEAQNGNAQVVGVVGEPGVGKSRLCEEFVSHCRARGIGVFRAHGLSHGKNLPFFPAVELLREFFDITDADSPDAAREKIAGRLVLYGVLDSAKDELAILFDFLEIPDPAWPLPTHLSPEGRLRRLFTLLRAVTRRRTEREMRVILLEDMHWFDPASCDFAEMLIESYPGTRTLVLANFRPEFGAPWMRHSYYRQVPLTPLGPDSVRDLLDELLGRDPSLVDLPDRIVERTGGNPFFVEEVVRALFEDGTLAGSPGGYRLTAAAVERLRVPSTVQSLLAARIDRLAAREKQVLHSASVVGRTFSEPVLRLVTQFDEDDLAASLRALCAAEFLQEESPYPQPEYRFWHPLTREVAYGSLLGDRRAALHGRVAEAIAELEPERVGERAGLLAQHWEQAGQPMEAALWNSRAGSRAGYRDYEEAGRRWQATIRLLSALPESEDVLEMGIGARTRLVRLAFRLGGDAPAAEALADEAQAMAERLGDEATQIQTMYAKAFLIFGLGRVGDAVDLFTEATELSDRHRDPDTRSVRFMLVWALSITGPLEQGVVYDAEMAELVAARPDLGLRFWDLNLRPYTLHTRAWLLARMGRLTDALHAADQVSQDDNERFEPDVVAFALPAQAQIGYLTGHGSQALAYAQRGLALARELGNPFSMVLAQEASGAALLAAGEPEAAVRPLGEALARARDHQVARFEEAALLAFQADALLLNGAHDAAVATAGEAVAVAQTQRARVHECQARLVRARALRSTGGLRHRNEIVAELSAVESGVAETGAAVWLPFLHEERARLAALEGDRPTAEAETAEARRGFKAMAATGHLARLEKEAP